MNRRNVTCDACSAVFDISGVEVKKEKLTNDRIGMYFVCPACGTKFPFAGITSEGLRLKAELKSLVKKIDKAKDEKTKERYVKKQQEVLLVYSKEVSGPYNEMEVLKG
jgi:uncharacterized protein YlaI